MAVCKKCGYNNPDDARYCANCKAEMMGVDPAVMKANMDRVNEEFENDARASLDVNRLTFICDVCGKVNPINVPGKKCVRCGKKMPRSAYLKAVQKMQKAGLLTPPVDTAPVAPPQPVQQPQPPVAQPAPVQQPQVVERQDYPQVQQVYRMASKPQPPQQNGAVIQPFVIVPYVSQSQPVYQYQSNVVYRYTEYTEEEKRRNQEALLRYQKERKDAELQRMQAEADMQRELARKQAEIQRQNPMYGGGYGYGKNNVRITSLVKLFFAIATVFVLFFLDVIVPNMQIEGTTINFALCQDMAGSNSVYGVVASLIAGAPNWPVTVGGWVMLISTVLFGLIMLGIAGHSIIRIIRGHSNFKAIILPILALVMTLVSYVGFAFKSGAFDINAFTTEIWPNYIYCAVIRVFVPIVMILIGILTKTDKSI